MGINKNQFESAQIKMNELLELATKKGGFNKLTKKESSELTEYTKLVNDYESINDLILKNMKQQFIERLINEGFVKFGTFQLKSGKESNIYFDIRNIISFPEMILDVTSLLKEKLIPVNRICGVPYGALSLSTALSLETKIPQILKRKEAKSYGSKKIIDGNFNQGDKVLLIEDVITSGLSLIETISELETNGLIIEKILVVLDRQEGGVDLLKEKGYNVESILTKEELLNFFEAR